MAELVIQSPLPPVPHDVQKQGADPSRPADTTFQEDLIVAAQRRINLIWEVTQSAIALVVVLAAMIVGAYQGFLSIVNRPEYPVILSTTLGVVVGFYFGRTNHTATGGIGPKKTQVFEAGR